MEFDMDAVLAEAFKLGRDQTSVLHRWRQICPRQ